MRKNKFICFLYLFITKIKCNVQPARWDPIDTDHEYFATKSLLETEHNANTETEFIQFYYKTTDLGAANPEQVMSIRKNGIYTTAVWDYTNFKAHFLYDKYTCDTHPLTAFEGAPIFFFDYHNADTGIDYYFVPIIRLLENEVFTTDVKSIPHDSPVTIRGRPAWQWSARVKSKGHSAAADIFYSIEKENVKSVPLRVVIYTDESATDVFIIFEIFKFRLTTPDPEVFQFPEFAACETTHTPLIPQIVSSFHVKLEIKDSVLPVYESPVYDMNIHYEYDQKLSYYSMATTGFQPMVDIWGDTHLVFVSDFNADLMYVMDNDWGNCSIYSMSTTDTDENDWPASDFWIHGGMIAMKDPEWFWHIPDPKAYWYKGNSTTRYIDSYSWAMDRPDHQGHGYTFEWHFSNEDWVFYEGEANDQRLTLLINYSYYKKINLRQVHVCKSSWVIISGYSLAGTSGNC